MIIFFYFGLRFLVNLWICCKFTKASQKLEFLFRL